MYSKCEFYMCLDELYFFLYDDNNNNEISVRLTIR